jgi:hypothetical protein
VDLTRELQCWDCDPPGKILKEKYLAAKARHAKQQRAIEVFDEPDDEG